MKKKLMFILAVMMICFAGATMNVYADTAHELFDKQYDAWKKESDEWESEWKNLLKREHYTDEEQALLNKDVEHHNPYMNFYIRNNNIATYFYRADGPKDVDVKITGASVSRWYKNNTPEELAFPYKTEDTGDPIVSISDYGFENDEYLKTIYIPEGVRYIGNYAFKGCTNLEKVVLPDTVEYIGNNAFANCKSLKSINLPKSLKVKRVCFYGCTSLKEVYLPRTLKDISFSYVVLGNTERDFNVDPESNVTITLSDGNKIYAWDNQDRSTPTYATVSSEIYQKSKGKIWLGDPDDPAEIAARAKEAKLFNLNKSSVTLAPKKAIKLIARYDGTKINATKVKWSSSRKSVATISKYGVITAKKTGKTTITAKYKGKTFKCKVTVKIPVTKVKASKKSVTIRKGKSKTVKAAVYPKKATNKKIKWSSSDQSVCTVNSKGKITGKKKGKAYVYATSKDNKKIRARIYVVVQ